MVKKYGMGVTNRHLEDKESLSGEAQTAVDKDIEKILNVSYSNLIYSELKILYNALQLSLYLILWTQFLFCLVLGFQGACQECAPWSCR